MTWEHSAGIPGGPGNNSNIRLGDTPSIDAFARMRVSEPTTIFDSKQIFDNQPLFWDDQEVSGSGTTSNHSINEARTRIGVALNTAGNRTRQTFMRFNYQPGKSQLIFMTVVLSSSGASGIKASAGIFDDNNGLFFTSDDGVLKAVRRTFVSGSAVDNKVDQADWNLDTMDGNGISGITLDPTKTQILIFDFEWLGVGRVRMGFVVDGLIYYAHEFLNANNLSVVYMSTPNLPLRYELINDGNGPATTMDHICTSVISEGGIQDLGVLRYASTKGTHINANTADVIYAVMGIRLKSANLGASIKIENVSLLSASNDDYEWILILNPTLANAITFSDQTNSSVQTGTGNAGNPSNSTVTGGIELNGGMVKGGANAGSIRVGTTNAILLGSTIAGVPDEIYLCVRPYSSNADIDGGINWREIS